jgi:hypothetical protein
MGFCHLGGSFWVVCSAYPATSAGAVPSRETTLEAKMGFMDKAKKLAEQAQQKLDEAQQNFNKGGSTPGQPGAGAGPTYDQHGRPVEDSAPAPDPAAPEPPAAEEPASEQPTQGLDPNATPDPFKPLQK